MAAGFVREWHTMKILNIGNLKKKSALRKYVIVKAMPLLCKVFLFNKQRTCFNLCLVHTGEQGGEDEGILAAPRHREGAARDGGAGTDHRPHRPPQCGPEPPDP